MADVKNLNVATSVVRMDALCAADQRLMQAVLSTGARYEYAVPSRNQHEFSRHIVPILRTKGIISTMLSGDALLVALLQVTHDMDAPPQN